MKRLFFPVLLCLILGGCGSAYEDMREIESFEIIRTVGIDYADGMYTVTAATGTGSGGEVTVLTAEAVTIARAMQQMQNYSSRRYVFFGHASDCLVGEEAALHDLSACLEYVERGFDMRRDAKLFVVRGGTAEDAIAGASEGGESINDHLTALEKDVQILSENHVYDIGDIAEELAADGCAVVTAVSLWDNDRMPVGEHKKDVRVVGLAVIDGGRLAGYADVDTARAVTLLSGCFVSDSAELPDGCGNYVAVELTEGRAEYEAVFDEEGTPVGIIINVELRGSISEMESPIDIYDPEVIAGLERKLALREQERLTKAVELSRRLNADLLELGRQLELKHPAKIRRAKEKGLMGLPADLATVLRVKAEIRGAYELGVSPAEKETWESAGGENQLRRVCGGSGGVHILAHIPAAAGQRAADSGQGVLDGAAYCLPASRASGACGEKSAEG